jgi:hypothetical protein
MQRRYLVWIDANGFTRLTLINTASGSASIVSQLLALSNADYLNFTDSTLFINPTPSPTIGTYQRVADCAMLLYQDSTGEQVSIQLPSPQSSIFLSDQQTIDTSSITALNTAVIGTLLSASGNPVTSFVGGIRKPTTRENYQ